VPRLLLPGEKFRLSGFFLFTANKEAGDVDEQADQEEHAGSDWSVATTATDITGGIAGDA
jgi:hypothetical protein